MLGKFCYEKVKSYQFDFHSETAGDNFELDNLVQKFEKILFEIFGYFAWNQKTDQKKS
jgi:hypothetical protein